MDNLTKILGKDTFLKNIQAECDTLNKENIALKLKVESLEHQIHDFQEKSHQFKYSNKNNDSVTKKIDEFVETILRFEPKKNKNFASTLEKIQFLQMYIVEILSKQKTLVEEYQQLEENHCELLQSLEKFENDVDKLHAENNFLEKTLSAEHQTVTSRFFLINLQSKAQQ